MASSIFGNQGNNTVRNTLNQLRSASNGNIYAACNLLDRAGITRTLPNGQLVTATQFAQMMYIKTPEQAFNEIGLDYRQIQNLL